MSAGASSSTGGGYMDDPNWNINVRCNGVWPERVAACLIDEAALELKLLFDS